MRFKLALAVAILVASASSAARARAAEGGPPSPDGTLNSRQAQAAASEADKLSATARQLIGEGKFDEALPLARRALELTEAERGAAHPSVGVAVYLLAVVHAKRAEYVEAEKLYRRALEVFGPDPGPYTAVAAGIANDLGVISFNKNQHKEAAQFFERSLDLRARAAGPEHPSLIHTLLNLFASHAARLEVKKGEPFLLRAISIIEKQPPKRDVATAIKLESSLCALYDQKREEAVRLLKRNILRLEEPELWAEAEQKAKEREAKGEKDDGRDDLLNGRAISKPAPSYPSEAKQARAMGTVVVRITVDESGAVIDARPVCGHPLLTRPAAGAVSRWRFTPTLLGGKPVKVTGVAQVNFVLQ